VNGLLTNRRKQCTAEFRFFL